MAFHEIMVTMTTEISTTYITVGLYATCGKIYKYNYTYIGLYRLLPMFVNIQYFLQVHHK